MRQAERAARDHGRGRRLQTQGVDEQPPIGEAQSGNGRKDTKPIDVRPREVHGGAAFEIGERIATESDVIASGERCRPNGTFESRRVKQLVYCQRVDLTRATNTVTGGIDVDLSVEGE